MTWRPKYLDRAATRRYWGRRGRRFGWNLRFRFRDNFRLWLFGRRISCGLLLRRDHLGFDDRLWSRSKDLCLARFRDGFGRLDGRRRFNFDWLSSGCRLRHLERFLDLRCWLEYFFEDRSVFFFGRLDHLNGARFDRRISFGNVLISQLFSKLQRHRIRCDAHVSTGTAQLFHHTL